jgi:HAD superfamily hydrolase (TIGR01549 family)
MPPLSPLSRRIGHFRAATFDYWETLIEERSKGAAALETTVAAFYRDFRTAFDLPAEEPFQEAFQRRLVLTRKRMTEDLLEVPLDRFFPLFFEDLGLPQPVREEASRTALHQVTELVHEASVVLPGAREFLAFLKDHGIRVGLVSNTQIPPAERKESLRRLKLLPYFDAVLLSSGFIHRKPKPEIFQEALRLLQVEPCECIHFGDHLAADVVGARNAGILPIQVMASRNASSAGDADLVVRSWDAALTLFSHLL